MTENRHESTRASDGEKLPRDEMLAAVKRITDTCPSRPRTREPAPGPPIKNTMISPATSSALRGLNDAAFRFDNSAQRIADGSADLPTDIVEGEMLAPTAYAANARVLETHAAMTKALLDIRA